MGLWPGQGWEASTGSVSTAHSVSRHLVSRVTGFHPQARCVLCPPPPYTVGPSGYGQVLKNPGVTLSTEHLPLPAAFSALTHIPLQSILGVPTSRGTASCTGPHRTSSHCCTKTSLVSGSRGPREPGDRLKERGGAVGSPQAVGPEKTPGSKELMHRLRPSNPGSRRLSKPQVLHL